MKHETASIELHCLVDEMQELVGGKVDRIYNPNKKEVLLQFHLTGKGKKILRILVPSFMYLTDFKPKQEQATGFCMFLRKHLENARLRKIEQTGFERVVEFVFEKEEKCSLFVELFNKGNIILCKDDVIVAPLEVQKFRERTIKSKEIYIYPKKEFDFLKITENELEKLVDESKQDSIVKVLAIELGLGGHYSEELCLLSGIDKKKGKLDKDEILMLFESIKKLRKTKAKPNIVYEGGFAKVIVPFELRIFAESEKKYFESYNEAFDYYFTEELKMEIKEKGTLQQRKTIEKLKKIIEMQEVQIKEMEKSIEENRKKGEAIYENYQLINEILTELKKARERYSWKEIKEKLKNHKTIKEINEKDRKILVEI